MVTALAKAIIAYKKASEDQQRSIYGKVCGFAGIFFNLILFGLKYVIGQMSGSIAIMADAFNNLSDAASSIITLMGFWMGSRRADREHPFGHGRMEYISGMVVSMLVMIMGWELLTGSVKKLFHPTQLQVEGGIFIALLISILVKLYMAGYNLQIGKKISSGVLKATAFDSLSDSVSTLSVLLSLLLGKRFGWNIDGLAGTIVSIFILSGGIQLLKETVSPLLGQIPDQETVEKIKGIVLEKEEILGIHDMIVHDYGPEQKMVSLHAEVDGSKDIFHLHDAIDEVEEKLLEEMGMLAIIHMDPVRTDDPELAACKKAMAELVAQIDERLTIHDFRMKMEGAKRRFTFEVTIPEKFTMPEDQLKEEVQKKAQTRWPDCKVKIQVEIPFV